MRIKTGFVYYLEKSLCTADDKKKDFHSTAEELECVDSVGPKELGFFDFNFPLFSLII